MKIFGREKSLGGYDEDYSNEHSKHCSNAIYLFISPKVDSKLPWHRPRHTATM